MKTIHAIETKDLTKTFGKVEALRGMSLSVPQGSLCGLIGLNGAGKTTTIRLLLAMAKANSGSARVLGLDALDPEQNRLIRLRTAYIPERKDLFPYMTARDVMQFTAGFYPKWNAEIAASYAKSFEIPLDRNVTKLSKGTLVKLHLVMALARGAELLILDEPTDGLDAVASDNAMQALSLLVAEQGTTVLICSHRMEEIEQIADHLCLVHQGQCLKQGSLDDMRSATRRIHFGLEATPEQLGQLGRLGILKRNGLAISVLTDSHADEVIELARNLGAFDIEAHPVPLRDYFVELVRGQDALA
jgi:ABC-2 type transport system ATP-binding protein